MHAFLRHIKTWSWPLLLLLSNLSFASHERQLDINWIVALGLTDAQQQHIHQAESKYREATQQLNQSRCSAAEVTEKSQQLQQQLRQDLQAVLSQQQKLQASQLMHDRHKTMQLQQVRDIVRALQLPPEQGQELMVAINELEFDYQWPLDLTQRDAAKAQFEQQLQNHLSAEQWQQWQQILRKQQKRWYDSAEFDKKCPHAEEQYGH